MILSRDLNKTRLLHERYQMNLSFWNKFVIWYYTYQSSTINGSLINIVTDDNILIWSKKLFSVFRDMSIDESQAIPNHLSEFTDNFNTPAASVTIGAALRLMKLYITDLQRVITESPPLTGTIVVYKASSPYAELKVGKVHQRPFNSTSYRADMNYNTFLPVIGSCCMHKIALPKDSRALILSPLLSAYPDESEVLLPHGITLDVRFISNITLNVPKGTQQPTYKQIQEQPLTLGPVFAYNHKVDCQSTRRQVKLYNSVMVNV